MAFAPLGRDRYFGSITQGDALGYVLNAPLGRYRVSTAQPPSDVLSLLDINPLKGVYVIEGDIISPQFH